MPRATILRAMWVWLPPTLLMPRPVTTSAMDADPATSSLSRASVCRAHFVGKWEQSIPASRIFARR